ncbi:hypothetical protein PIROE2DRAFT_65704, partial [Piromyces sp. E2]
HSPGRIPNEFSEENSPNNNNFNKISENSTHHSEGNLDNNEGGQDIKNNEKTVIKGKEVSENDPSEEFIENCDEKIFNNKNIQNFDSKNDNNQNNISKTLINNNNDQNPNFIENKVQNNKFLINNKSHDAAELFKPSSSNTSNNPIIVNSENSSSNNNEKFNTSDTDNCNTLRNTTPNENTINQNIVRNNNNFLLNKVLNFNGSKNIKKLVIDDNSMVSRDLSQIITRNRFYKPNNNVDLNTLRNGNSRFKINKSNMACIISGARKRKRIMKRSLSPSAGTSPRKFRGINKGLYVDDMVIAGENKEIIKITNIISNKFKISKSEPINFILGIKVENNDNKYTISQENFINNILYRYNIKYMKSRDTPCT